MSKQNNWTSEDLEACLKRAFVDKKASYIVVDGHTLRSEFLKESVNYGVEKEWLMRGKDIDEDEILGRGLGQYFAYTYRLTGEGRQYFGLK